MEALTIRENSSSHQRYPIGAEEDVGVLRRAVRQLAVRVPALPDGAAELVATELATNILRHTSGGYVLLRPTSGGVELVAVDRGPGLPPDARQTLTALPAGLTAGPPRAGGLGVGLATVRRRSALVDCYTATDGTVILARLGHPGPWLSGGVNVPLGGTGPSGDAWAVTTGARLAAVLVDGLGHGPEAAEASRAAIIAFEQARLTDASTAPEAGLTDFTAQAHRAMRGTRGGALGVCVLDPPARRAVFAGIGNVAGRISTRDGSRYLAAQPGTLGTELPVPRIRTVSCPWAPGSVLVLASDGIETRWDPSSRPGLLRHHPTVIAALLHRDHTRTTDDAAILVIGDNPTGVDR